MSIESSVLKQLMTHNTTTTTTTTTPIALRGSPREEEDTARGEKKQTSKALDGGRV